LIFFGEKDSEASLLITEWQWPWICLVIATAVNILALPFLALVEGSGRVGEAYGIRLLQGVFGSIGCWAVLSIGGGLWAPSMIPSIGFLVVLAWLIFCRPALLHNAWRMGDSHIHWSHEIWPLQWRIGLSWLSGYFLTQIYTPILFYYQGAEVAGQMGLSLSIANMLGLLAQSWIARRVPVMAQAAGRQDWNLLDKVCPGFCSIRVGFSGWCIDALRITFLLFRKNHLRKPCFIVLAFCWAYGNCFF